MDIVEMGPGVWRVLLAGSTIGRISRHALGTNRKVCFRAEAIDGVELGSFSSMHGAHEAILSDDADGRPRDETEPPMKRPKSLAAV